MYGVLYLYTINCVDRQGCIVAQHEKVNMSGQVSAFFSPFPSVVM
jgi:hypothetical protein